MVEPTVRSVGPEPPARPTPTARPPERTTQEPPRRAADHALRILSLAPPLALMALVAALFELALARIAWHGLSDVLGDESVRTLRRLAQFPRTLAAVAGLVALLVALLGFLRLPGFAPIFRRLAVAGFSGVFVPAIAVATFLPAESLRRRLVVFGLAAANVLVTLLAMTAARYRPGTGLRVAMIGASVTSFLSLAVIGLAQLAQSEADGPFAPLGTLFAENPGTTLQVLMATRHVAEVAWLLTPVAAAWTVVAHGDRATLRRRALSVLALSGTWVAAILAFQELVGHRFRLVLFGAFRLGLLVDELPAAYALPLGLTLGAGLFALTRRTPALPQLGMGMLVWLCAGFAPHTPIQLLYLVLAGLLLTRAAQALDPEGAWRDQQPWARFLPSEPA